MILRYLALWILLALVSLSPSSALAQSKKANNKPKEKLKCSKEELKRKDCLLSFGDYELSLNSEKILVKDKVWRKVVDQPIQSELAEWSEISVDKLSNSYVLQSLIWTEPKTELGLQDLMWNVGVIEGVELFFYVKEMISKRHLAKDRNDKEKFVTDRKEKISIKASGPKELSWSVGPKKGMITLP